VVFKPASSVRNCSWVQNHHFSLAIAEVCLLTRCWIIPRLSSNQITIWERCSTFFLDLCPALLFTVLRPLGCPTTLPTLSARALFTQWPISPHIAYFPLFLFSCHKTSPILDLIHHHLSFHLSFHLWIFMQTGFFNNIEF